MAPSNYRLGMHAARFDLDLLQQRVRHQRQRHRSAATMTTTLVGSVARFWASPTSSLRRLPSRVLLHVVIGLCIPGALALNHLTQQAVTQVVPTIATSVEQPLPIGVMPLGTVDSMRATHAMVGDAPLADDEAMPIPLSLISQREALAPLTVKASISADQARFRNGPGTNYDEFGTLAGGSEVQVIGRYGEWLQVRGAQTMPAYWVARELVNIPDTAVYAIAELAASQIPAPPPPKIGMIVEDQLNLRDGPGTNYVAMTKLQEGQTYTLLEQYQDWMHIAGTDVDGWVKRDFLAIGDGILPRVHVTTEIPDPNPALVASVTESLINLRSGPSSDYPKSGSLKAGAQVDLVAHYKDWYKVKDSTGSVAWVFGDLLNMSPRVARRVPATTNIPALPRAQTRTGGGTTNASTPARKPGADIPVSGDVASYAVQFVGYPYVWGGSSPSRGFDCSGLVSYVYRQYGISLPRTAASQYSSAYGSIIDRMEDLQSGDLVFFVGTAGPGISHVAIYVGGGRIVHAMTPRYGVQVSSLWDDYWSRHYYGGLRVYR